MQKVETIEPVEKTTAKWVEKQEAIETPKIVRRKVAYVTTTKVPYTIKMRVRVDSFGNSIGEPEPVDAQWRAWFKAMEEKEKAMAETSGKSGDSVKSVVDKPVFDKSSIYYTDPSFEPNDRSKRKAADTVPTLKETAGTSKSAEGPTTTPDIEPTVNKVAKPKVRSNNRVRSILVPETQPDISATTKMKVLSGEPVKIEIESETGETSARTPAAVAEPTPAAISEPTPAKALTENVMENKFVAPVRTKTETNFKPDWKTFDPQLIDQPSRTPAGGSVDTISVPDIDRVDPLKRQPLKEIY